MTERGTHRSPPQSRSLRPRERCESKKREDEPAQADKEDLGSGGRAAGEGRHHAKLQLKRGGMEGQRPRSRAEGPKRFARLALSYLQPTALLPSPARVVEEGIDGPHGGGRTGFPLCGRGEGEVA